MAALEPLRAKPTTTPSDAVRLPAAVRLGDLIRADLSADDATLIALHADLRAHVRDPRTPWAVRVVLEAELARVHAELAVARAWAPDFASLGRRYGGARRLGGRAVLFPKRRAS